MSFRGGRNGQRARGDEVKQEQDDAQAEADLRAGSSSRGRPPMTRGTQGRRRSPSPSGMFTLPLDFNPQRTYAGPSHLTQQQYPRNAPFRHAADVGPYTRSDESIQSSLPTSLQHFLLTSNQQHVSTRDSGTRTTLPPAEVIEEDDRWNILPRHRDDPPIYGGQPRLPAGFEDRRLPPPHSYGPPIGRGASPSATGYHPSVSRGPPSLPPSSSQYPNPHLVQPPHRVQNPVDLPESPHVVPSQGVPPGYRGSHSSSHPGAYSPRPHMLPTGRGGSPAEAVRTDPHYYAISRTQSQGESIGHSQPPESFPSAQPRWSEGEAGPSRFGGSYQERPWLLGTEPSAGRTRASEPSRRPMVSGNVYVKQEPVEVKKEWIDDRYGQNPYAIERYIQEGGGEQGHPAPGLPQVHMPPSPSGYRHELGIPYPTPSTHTGPAPPWGTTRGGEGSSSTSAASTGSYSYASVPTSGSRSRSQSGEEFQEMEEEEEEDEGSEYGVKGGSGRGRGSKRGIKRRLSQSREGGEGGGKRRTGKKTMIACDFCRGRKLRCDGNRPSCWNCMARDNQECVYQAYPRRRGPGKAPKGSRAKKEKEKEAEHESPDPEGAGKGRRKT